MTPISVHGNYTKKEHGKTFPTTPFHDSPFLSLSFLAHTVNPQFPGLVMMLNHLQMSFLHTHSSFSLAVPEKTKRFTNIPSSNSQLIIRQSDGCKNKQTKNLKNSKNLTNDIHTVHSAGHTFNKTS